jgi:hypothetical protein
MLKNLLTSPIQSIAIPAIEIWTTIATEDSELGDSSLKII